MSSIIIVEKHDCAGVNKNVQALHPKTFVPSLSKIQIIITFTASAITSKNKAQCGAI
jgi:hypothetical protein